MLILFQDNSGGPPDPDVAPSYAEALGNPDFAVLADTSAAIIDATPYQGTTLPGKCVLGPQMEILDCYTGDEDESAFETILEHHAAQQ